MEGQKTEQAEQGEKSWLQATQIVAAACGGAGVGMTGRQLFVKGHGLHHPCLHAQTSYSLICWHAVPVGVMLHNITIHNTVVGGPVYMSGQIEIDDTIMKVDEKGVSLDDYEEDFIVRCDCRMWTRTCLYGVTSRVEDPTDREEEKGGRGRYQ